MKGIIFTEFLDIIEDNFGLEVCQQMLDDTADEGSYTAVGSYDHRDLVKLIVALSQITHISAESLQEIYGEAVFIRLLNSLPQINDNPDNTFGFIKRVEEHIHTEVKKLYPDATPPKFDFLSHTATSMVMDYKSARCMSHVCFGLIKGCAKHFDENIDITMTAISPDKKHVRFTINLV
ncbi:guanylate cyclase [Photobacterium aquae]|uniref:Guanylate cyclase n=1 Tax=Photobacterium aquae TaxID=1195763 RepID=A0A0J1GX11_9GAMM|nr:heme NO-binding domain-containing protein [Photobacterium aquae]KLV04195.1 guanylate cyclase [Photobacterium aquae]